MLINNGHLLLSLSSFSTSSVLASFGIASDGTYNGSSSTLLDDSDRLGDLRMHDGSLYFSSGDGVFELVPEPGAASLMFIGTALLLGGSWRKLRS